MRITRFKSSLHITVSYLLDLVGVPPVEEPVIIQNIFDHETVTVAGDNEGGTSLTLGVVFNTKTKGEIKGISFYKSAGDTATSRTVGVFSSAGVLLASGSSTGEIAGPGWVSINLDIPYIIDADTNHVAAVFYPQGHYPFQSGVFASPVVRGDLIAESDVAAPDNGRYKYGASLTYPDSGGHGSFGVDVNFMAHAFPTIETTGVPAGTTLTPMTGEVHLWDGGETILENVDLDGFVLIQAANCVIRNCRIRNTNSGAAAVVRIDGGSGGSNVGLLIENCELDGTGVTVNGYAGGGTIRGCYIHGVDNGINVYDSINAQDNYINITDTSTGEPHYDGIEMNGGSNTEIRHNTIIVNEPQTSAVMLNNAFAGLSNIKIIDNYLSGGGYTIYCDNSKSAEVVDAASIQIRYNALGIGQFGYYSLYTSGVTPLANYDAVTKASV